MMEIEDFELTPTQKGSVTEHLVASILMMASGGRLSPFMPMSDDHGIDLILLDKATHTNCSNSYLIAVLFDPAQVTIAQYWLIPMQDITEISNVQAAKYALSPSISVLSADRYRQYRHDDPHALTAAVLRLMT